MAHKGTITLKPTAYPNDAGKQLTSDDTIVAYSKHQGRVTRFGIGYITPEGSGRQTYQGPIVPGPWPFTFALATVISAHKVHSPRDDGQIINMEVGDTVEINGLTYKLVEDKWLHDPYLIAA